MRTAILQSRQHHVPEADKAFQRAQTLLSAELNQEGLAELDYERGYAVNVGGDPVQAQHYLEKALEEAKAIPSVQLQIRTLTQLSSVAMSSDRYEQAIKDAEDAIHLAQSNQLDLWAADGYLRLANAELRQGHLAKAEEAAQEALRLSRQGQQRRTEAGANLTMASIMSQRHLSDNVIAPAESALAYYKQNGFFREEASLSLLLARARRDRGEYAKALEAGKASKELATKSGIRQLMALSDEVVGTTYLELEQYPSALEKFQIAKSEADGTSAKAYQSLHCAETLWRLGRYSESEEMLQSVPATETFEYELAEVRVPLLLSRMQYGEIEDLAEKALAKDPKLDSDQKNQLELQEALAKSRLRMKPAAFRRMGDVSTGKPASTVGAWRTQLTFAELALSLGMTQQALDTATKTADYFAATNQSSSELRSVLIGASAAETLNNKTAYDEFSKKSVDILSQLQQTWGPQALGQYLLRPDLQTLMREASISAPINRR
jgi:tetratricopeptide (TPR) repeat protein